MFWSLFDKNFIYWRRNWVSSLLEVILPLAVVLIGGASRGLIDPSTFTRQPFNSKTIISNPSALLGDLSSYLLYKDCGESNRAGGRVVLVPENDITRGVSQVLGSLNYTSVYMSSVDQVNEFLRDPDYTVPFENGTRRQFCFGVAFGSEGPGYEYSLLFNNSNPRSPDSARLEPAKIAGAPDSDSEFSGLVRRGVAAAKILVDSLILKKEIGENVGIRLRRTQAETYEYGDYESLKLPLALAFVLAGLIPFLRVISVLVGERERKVTASLESVGAGRLAQTSAVCGFFFSVQVILGIIFCILIKILLLKKTNFLIIFLAFLFFQLVVFTLALLLSGFFANTKRALIAGILFYIFLMIFWLIKDNISGDSEGLSLIVSLSPLGNISLLIDVMFSFESYFSPFGFSELAQKVLNFRGQTFFFVSIVEVILFALAGLYVMYVFPTGEGIPKHPLFFFGFEKSEPPAPPVKARVDPAMLESPNQELLAQSPQNKTIRVEGLSKLYNNGKLAVDSLSLEMFSDQIFVLLGHNGAGKTTLVSMIAGSFPQTGGKIAVLGFDSLAERPQIQKIMGVCPQINPILPYLTVTEHLTLFAKVKGIQDCKQEVDELLRDIDLYHKRDSFCGKLSGGQKRKLCIALAFVGGSKVIILDEPTSGMDTYARRFMWDMLKKYKKDRIIILTTHNMDEAEYLGDRIAIMSQGALGILGSSMFLKRKFDVGYVLTAVKTRDLPDHEGVVLSALNRHVSGAAYLTTSGRELRYRLPFEESGKFESLFAELEDQTSELCISDIGISVTTLEDVFLQATEREDAPLEAKPLEAKIEEAKPDETKRVGGLEEIRLEPGKIFWMQLKGLLVKKLLYTRRDIGGLLAEVIVPVLIMIIGFGLLKVELSAVAPPEKLVLSALPNNTFYINEFSLSLGGASVDTSAFLNALPRPAGAKVVNLGSISEEQFDSELFERRSDENFFSIFFDGSANPPGFTIFVNSTATNSAVLGVAAASDAILRVVKGSQSGITTFITPFQNTSGTKNIEEVADGIIIALFFAIAFTFISSSMIVGIIKERESGFKNQQVISGVNLFGYWLGHFIIDFAKIIVVSMIMYLLVFLFKAEFLYSGDRWLMTLLLFIFFSFDLVFSVYLISFLFSKPFNGQIFMFLFCFVTSYFLVIVNFVLKAIESSRSAAHNVIQNIFRIFPHFGFTNGIVNMSNTSIYRLMFKWGMPDSSFDKRVSLVDLIYIIILMFVIPLIILLIEKKDMIFTCRGKKKGDQSIQVTPQLNTSNTEEIYIGDVENPENGNETMISLTNVKKEYKIGTGCGKRKILKAVKGVSLNIPRGEVLGLLGTNGAGKSSTFRMLAGEMKPTSGEVKIKGENIPEHIDKVRHLIGYCPQIDTLDDKLNVREHLQLFARLRGIDPKYHESLIAEAIDKLNLRINQDRLAGTFSGGNKRKLCVAIALLGKPPIVFLDEPSSGMDPQSRRFMWNVVSELAVRKGLSTVILTTHSMEEAEALTTRIAIMVEGRLKTVGSNQQIKQKFGQGLEIQIKLLPLFELKFGEIKKMIAEKLGSYPEDTSSSKLSALLEAMDSSDLAKEISEKGKGSKIYSLISQEESISTKMIIEWAIFYQAARKVEAHLQKNFELSIIEEFGSYLKIEVMGEQKLSKIFGIIEASKQELSIEDYSVRQMSLEQIFIKFAKKNVHDE